MKSLAWALVVAVAACGNGDDGSPPSLSALVIDPVETTIDTFTTYRGSFAMTDPDADVVRIVFRVVAPDGNFFEPDPVVLDPIRGIAAATIRFETSFKTGEVGVNRFQITLGDKAGHTSQVVEASITAR